MNFSFRVPEEIVYGLDCVDRIGELTGRWGQRVLLVTGRQAMQKLGILDRVKGLLESAGLAVYFFSGVEPEPSVDTVDAVVRLAKNSGCDVVIGLGGGSVLDVAKAVAGMVGLEGSVADYQNGKVIDRPGIPFIGVPTTSGTGSEVTNNSVLINPREKVKKSVRSWYWLAKVALVDAKLTLGVPAEVTASAGMDALAQAIEAYVSKGAQPITDALALRAIELIGANLRKAVKEGDDLGARAGMAYGSLLSGMAFANAGLGVVHALAHPLGVHFGIPHGNVCALLLPHVMEYNLAVCADKFAWVAGVLGEEKTAALAVAAVCKLLMDLGMPLKLGEFGVKEAAFSGIVEAALPAGSLKYNPREAGADDLMGILGRAL